jgi:uncharacterized membrane protein
MLFFALLVLIAVLAAALRVPGWPARMRIAMAVALLSVGADHWINPQRYLPMMPAWVPLHLEMVLFTGAAEIAGALGLLVPRLRRAAGFMLALYFVAVFPANIHNAVHGLAVEGLPQVQWYYWVRLAFQPLAIWWALYSAELIRFNRVRAAP